jgi:hypothetical protein
MWTVATAEPRLTTCPLGARRRADPRVHVVSSCVRFSRQTTTSVWRGSGTGLPLEKHQLLRSVLAPSGPPRKIGLDGVGRTSRPSRTTSESTTTR